MYYQPRDSRSLENGGQLFLSPWLAADTEAGGLGRTRRDRLLRAEAYTVNANYYAKAIEQCDANRRCGQNQI